LSRARFDARRHQFIAGRKQYDFGPAIDRQSRMVHASGELEVARAQLMARGESHFAETKIQALLTHVAAFGRRFLNFDTVAVAGGLLLHHHRVGAVGQHAAGENARGFAWTDRVGEGPAGRDFADDFQAHRRRRDVACAHRVAVHRGKIRRRLGAARFDIPGQDAAVGIGERNVFGGQCHGVRQHVIERFFHRDQTCHSATR
jgi:hypothetical protein